MGRSRDMQKCIFPKPPNNGRVNAYLPFDFALFFCLWVLAKNSTVQNHLETDSRRGHPTLMEGYIKFPGLYE